ncbi:histidine phosphatase family protein [Microbacterium sp. 179-B 1A2 NHS]|uniref:histidine phosphatase family protein n=1 Tax=Microbacterium sp. 179-B 1A2 NHS TaxID=3142383 RepID=UPI0039A238A1
MTLTTLWLVRHGESVGNVAATEAEYSGLEELRLEYRDADTPLSSTGEEQARALGAWMERHLPEIGAVWVSPYVRARQTLATAREAAGVDGAAAVIDERLRDRELGVLDRLTHTGVASRYPDEAARRRRLGKYYHRPPGGESWADVALRLRSFLRDAAAFPTDQGLIVAHDAVVMLMLSLLLPLAEEELLAFAADHTVLNASVTRLDHDGTGWRLTTFADIAHLQREGADVTVHSGDPDVEPR